MMMIERALERFEALELARGFTRDYVRRFRTDLSSFKGFLLEERGKEDLREATRDDVVGYLVVLSGSHAPATVNLRLWRLRKLLGFLEREGLLLRNPAAGVERKTATSRMRDWLTEGEVLRLLEAPDTATTLGLRDRAMLELLYSSGLRFKELRELELDDLELAEGFVTVKLSKNRRGRRVPVGDLAATWLGSYLTRARPALVSRRRRTLVVFLSPLGSPIGHETTAKRMKHYAQLAGIDKHVTPHILRHTFAVHLLKHGASTRHIQEMLGHRRLESTAVYTRLFPAELERVHRSAHPSERRR